MKLLAPASPGSRLRLVAATVLVTSLAWIGGLAVWLSRPTAEGPAPAAGPAGPPAMPSPSPLPLRAQTSGERLIIPVAGIGAGQLVDTFAQSRAGGQRVHDAIDIVAPRGTPVVAAAAGWVEKLLVSRDGGNTAYLRSPDRTLLYYYAHLDAYAAGLAEGQRIAAGTPLGTVGSSGNADPAGPHLHFAIMQMAPADPWYRPGPALNPYPWLVAGQRPELGARTQRSAPSLPSGESLRRNARPEWE